MNCRYCGKSAGFLRSRHAACEERHQASLRSSVGLVRDAAVAGRRWGDVSGEIERVLAGGFVGRERLPELVLGGVDQAVDHLLDDDILNEDEEARIAGFMRSLDAFDGAAHPLPASGVKAANERLVKAAVVRMVLQGVNPASRQNLVGHVPFNFMKSEAAIWCFDDVEYHVMKKRVRYAGRSSGVSFRVARGVYLRTGGFRGQRHVAEEREHVDDGIVAVTTKHLYFAGATHRFRVRHDRIVSFVPYEDGVSITRDRANARPELFRSGDGWFFYNLVVNAQNVEA